MSTKEVVKRLMHYVKPYGALLVGALVCAVIYVVMSLLSPVLIGQAVDGIIVRARWILRALAGLHYTWCSYWRQAGCSNG